MANTMLDLNNEIINAAYKRTYESSAPQAVTFNKINVADETLEGLTSRVKAALNPMYDSAIEDRMQSSVQARAGYDADAFSRGMGASTWLTDVKAREGRAAASDITRLNASFGGTVAENATAQFQNYLGNKLQADSTNAQGQLSADLANSQRTTEYEQWVYGVVADMIKNGIINPNPSAGGGGWYAPTTGPDGIVPIVPTFESGTTTYDPNYASSGSGKSLLERY